MPVAGESVTMAAIRRGRTARLPRGRASVDENRAGDGVARTTREASFWALADARLAGCFFADYCVGALKGRTGANCSVAAQVLFEQAERQRR